MPITRKYRRRRRPIRRRPKKKVPRALQVHRFVERNDEDMSLDIALPSTTSHLSTFMDFQFIQANQSLTYSDIFRWYRLDKVVVTFSFGSENYNTSWDPQVNISGTRENLNEIFPTVYYQVQHHEEAPLNLVLLKQDAYTKKFTFSNTKRKFSVVLKPQVQIPVYASSAAVTYGPRYKKTWIRATTGTLSVPHYGLHALAVMNTTPQTQMITYGNIHVERKYYFSMKGQ